MDFKENIKQCMEKTKNFFKGLFFKKEKKDKKKKFELKQEIKDWFIAFIVAAVIYFIILPLFLGTTSPMVVVSSCSEQGYLNIGDILIVQGVSAEHINAPTVELQSIDSFTPLTQDGIVTAIEINGNEIRLNKSNDIVVYNSPHGQIIHRVFLKMKKDDKYFLITKGDSNNYPDQINPDGSLCLSYSESCLSPPVAQENIIGRIFGFPIPIFGHIKLFFCDFTFGLLCDGHANKGTGYEYRLWC